MTDSYKLFNIFYSSLSHELRTPLSIVQNEILYLEKTKNLEDINLIKDKLNLILATLKRYKLEDSKEVESIFNLNNLIELGLFNNNVAHFSDSFKDSKILVNINDFKNLFTYLEEIFKKLVFKNLVIKCDVVDKKCELIISYSLNESDRSYNKVKGSSLSVILKQSINMDIISAVFCDLIIEKLKFKSTIEIDRTFSYKIILGEPE